MSASKTIFSKSYPRASVWRQIALYPSQRRLAKMAEIHLRTQRQLVTFAFDDVSQQINTHGVYERQELETFFAWVESVKPRLFREATALDLGANIGNHSLFFSDYFKHVHAFEPNERTFKVLTLNSQLVSNITCHQVGLSDADGMAHFLVDPANVGASRIVPAGTSGASEIRLTTLDAAVLGVAEIKLIKVDVEGHDYAALVGAKETILAHKPIILFEQFADDAAAGESATVNLLRSYGYRTFAVIRRHPRAAASLPHVLRAAYAFIGRLVLGETMDIEVGEQSPKGYHAMVIAIPDWIEA
jgi:FkbM family methyltransferase